MLEQVGGSASQTPRAVSEMAETDIAWAANQPAEGSTTVIVVDMEALSSTSLTRRSAADRAPLLSAYGTDDYGHLGIEPQQSNAPAKKLFGVLLWVRALPGAFLRQLLGLLFRGAHDVSQVGTGEGRLTSSTTRSRFPRRAYADAERGNRQSSFTARANASLADFVAALDAKSSNDALQTAATARAPVVADPVTSAFQSPLRDALCAEAALVAFLSGRQFAPPAEGAVVVELPVTIRVQPEPTAARRSAPSTRFHGRPRACSRARSHAFLDGAGRAGIRRAA